MARQIALTRSLFAVIDDEDFDLVLPFKWIAVPGGNTFYADTTRGPNGGRISMHRLIVGCGSEREVDHKDGDGLNNRRKNLRECSHKENLRNRKKQGNTSSLFKGVSATTNGKWRAQIEQNGVQLKINTFDVEADAARAYDNAARVLFGSFAKTNSSMGLL